MTGAVLEAAGLSKRYGRGTWALQSVDLKLDEAGVVGLVGPNGAGKSTLIKTWMGFERATAGRAGVLGMDPWRQRGQAIRQIAYVPQAPALYRDLTVGDHLDLVVHYRGKAFDHAGAVRRLDDLNVPLRAQASSLSGGQAAQVGLAIAIGLRARVLLLDEPLASLDPLARREFIDILLDAGSESGATVILSSHIVSDIERACTSLVVLGVGRVQVQGPVARIKSSHMVYDAPPTGSVVVARLPSGETLCQIAQRTAPDGGRASTLEDIVLGYLVAGRAVPA